MRSHFLHSSNFPSLQIHRLKSLNYPHKRRNLFLIQKKTQTKSYTNYIQKLQITGIINGFIQSNLQITHSTMNSKQNMTYKKKKQKLNNLTSTQAYQHSHNTIFHPRDINNTVFFPNEEMVLLNKCLKSIIYIITGSVAQFQKQKLHQAISPAQNKTH